MITELEVDGVPAVLGPTSGPMHAGLVFRVGSADESLARRGITHLVEHLALFPAGVTDYHYNGVTGVEHTYFHLHGTADEITAFLTGVCAALRALPMHRLATEKEILRAEANSNRPSVTEQLPLWRHGARDHGLPSYPEWGLHAITEDDLAAWVARYFTRENAALWVAGDELPPGLRLDLPGGERRRPPAASSALPHTPAFFSGSAPAVVWGAEVRREPAAALFATVLERRMFRELRQEGGLSYQPQTAYDPRADGAATIVAVADALPEKREAVLGGFIDVLAGMRVGRIAPAEVAAVRNQARDGLRRAEEQGARLPGQAFRRLAGRPVQQLDDALAELDAVTTEQVVAVAAAAYETGLLMTPPGTTADWAGYTAAPTESEAAVKGVTLRPVSPGDGRLIVGEQGVSMVGPDGSAATVRYAACAAVLAWPDGGRQWIGHDGIVVRIEPTLYKDAGATIAAADARVPAGLRVPMPARDPGQIPQPRTARGPRTGSGGEVPEWAADVLRLGPRRARIAVGAHFALAVFLVVLGVGSLVMVDDLPFGVAAVGAIGLLAVVTGRRAVQLRRFLREA